MINKKAQTENMILGFSVMILGIIGSISLGYGLIVSEKIYELMGILTLIVAGAEPVIIDLFKSLFGLK